MIYTNVGNILIALNPFKLINGLYDQNRIERIYEMSKLLNFIIINQPIIKGKNKSMEVPHVFSIGSQAILDMKAEGKDQSILISGILLVIVSFDII